MPKRPRDTDTVKSLSELRDNDERINVIAVAYSSTPPTNTNGANHYVKFELVDQTTPTIVSCLLFAQLELLPDVSTFSHPAIVRLRRFQVQSYQGRFQLQNCPGHSWCTFGRDTDSLVPQDKSHENTGNKLTESEKGRIAELRNWLRSDVFNNTVFQRGPVYIPAQSAPNRTNSIKQQTLKFNKFASGSITLREIEKDLYFDLVAQVIGIRRDGGCSVVRCIDGTKPLIETFKNNSLYVKTHLSQLITAQLFDFYVDVAVYDEHIIVTEGVELGNFVEFKNLHCYIPSGGETCEVILHKGFMFNRGMRILRPDHESIPAVQQRINQIEVFTKTTWAPPSPPAFDDTLPPVTQLSDPDLPLTPILDILETNLHSTRPSSVYRIRVFVDSYSPDNYPSFLRHFCRTCNSYSISELCRKCGQECRDVEPFFTLQVRDYLDGFESEVKCFAGAAREFLRVGERGWLSVGQLEEVENVVGRWCELGVCCVRGVLVLKDCSLVESV